MAEKYETLLSALDTVAGDNNNTSRQRTKSYYVIAEQVTFKTIFPAVSVPLNDDFSINEKEFRVYLRWIKSFYDKGIKGLVCNGHTGEITGLTRAERKRVTEICAEECGDIMTINSGVNCENNQESIEMARAPAYAAPFRHESKRSLRVHQGRC